MKKGHSSVFDEVRLFETVEHGPFQALFPIDAVIIFWFWSLRMVSVLVPELGSGVFFFSYVCLSDVSV